VSRILVTGGSGFVGRRLIPALQDAGHSLAALTRTGSLDPRLADQTRLRVVDGDLLEPATYREALSTADLVVHLAAATGRASNADLIRVNAVGTEVLVDACRQARVSRLLFISSVAASFPADAHYPYAAAKRRAETAVQRSGLAFAILRPTMIFGPGSPVLAGLERMALLPVIPVFGSGRTLVQPVHVDDVVRFMVRVIDDNLFTDAVVDIGGREAVSIEELLQRIRTARRGRRGPVVHVPIGLVQGPLRVLEAVGAGGLLPLRAGQLASFRFPGTVTANPLQDRLQPTLLGVSDMLAPAEDADRSPITPLERECQVFTAHLVGSSPGAYVRRKYLEAHDALPELSAGDRFDRHLLRVARIHRVFARIADGYARVFAPASTLRKKLVVLLAIVETSAPGYRLVDDPIGGSRASVLARLVVRGTGALIGLAIGTILLGPVRLFVPRAR